MSTICAVICAWSMVGALPRDRYYDVLTWNVLVGGVIGIYALCQHLDVDILGWEPHDLVVSRSIGTLGNPDFLANYLVTLLPLCIMAPLAGTRILPRWAWGVMAAVMAVAILFSYTRGAWVAAAVQLALFALWRMPRRIGEFPWLIFLVSCVLLGAFFWFHESKVPQQKELHMTIADRARQTLVPNDDSTRARWALWREALLVASNHPWLGTGPATFTIAARPYRFVEPPFLLARAALSGDPHNVFLEVAAASGWPALLSLLGLVALAMYRYGRQEPLPQAGCQLTALVGCCVALLFTHSTTELELLFWLLIAGSAMTSDSPQADRLNGWRVAVMALSIVVTTAAVGSPAFRLLRSSYDLKLAESAVQPIFSSTTAVETRVLLTGLSYFDAALTRSSGVRRAGILLRKGTALEELYHRCDSQMRKGPERDFWEAVRAQARETYRASLQQDPLNPYAWHDFGRFLLYCGTIDEVDTQEAAGRRSIDQGISASRQGCELDPYNAFLWGEHAIWCARVGRITDAREAFERSLALAPAQQNVREAYQHLKLQHDAN